MLAGAYALGLLPHLPPMPVFVALTLPATLLYVVLAWQVPLFLVAGFSIMGLAAQAQLDDRLDAGLEGTTLGIIARIDEFPDAGGDSLRMVVRPLHRAGLPARIRLSWVHSGQRPALGETWHLQVSLRRPRGYANPGGFDYAGWLFRQRIGATGYVLAERHNYRIQGARENFIDRLRRRVVRRIGMLLPADAARAVLMAIAVGARQEIGRDQWDLYAATGTSHLMAISGLHIGLAVASATVFCWALVGIFAGRRNIRDIAILCAIVAAGGYAAMSGFAMPARRAFLMALIAVCLLLRRRSFGASTLLATTCLVVFLSDPLAILAPGFMLSFAAVAVLFATARQHVASDIPQPWLRKVHSGIVRTGLMQLALLAGLFPLTVLIFGRITLLAPFVNVLVLPLFNIITVPLALTGSLCDGPFVSLGDSLLRYSHVSIRLILWIVSRAGELEALHFRTTMPPATWIVLLPLTHLLLPAGWPGRRLAWLAVIAVIIYRPPPPPVNCLRYHALDVGQGLAVVLQTHSHVLLFDTGPGFPGGGGAAELVVLPSLVRFGIGRLDKVVVSHPDLDHAGGLRALIGQHEIGEILVGEPLGYLGNAQRRCVAGDGWRWEGVGFAVVHPRNSAAWTGNNASCVLEVSVGAQKLLLTGDIEAPVEVLLRYQGMLGKTHTLFVPHHGSRTSSSAALVNATRPEFAIVSAGYRNRWGFPKAEIVERWRRAGARVVNTATSGAISEQLCAGEPTSGLQQARLVAAKYWHDEVPSRR